MASVDEAVAAYGALRHEDLSHSDLIRMLRVMRGVYVKRNATGIYPVKWAVLGESTLSRLLESVTRHRDLAVAAGHIGESCHCCSGLLRAELWPSPPASVAQLSLSEA